MTCKCCSTFRSSINCEYVDVFEVVYFLRLKYNVNDGHHNLSTEIVNNNAVERLVFFQSFAEFFWDHFLWDPYIVTMHTFCLINILYSDDRYKQFLNTNFYRACLAQRVRGISWGKKPTESRIRNILPAYCAVYLNLCIL